MVFGTCEITNRLEKLGGIVFDCVSVGSSKHWYFTKFFVSEAPTGGGAGEEKQ
jgi:hypothetical protein